MALQSRLPGPGPPRGSALSKGLGFAVTETGGEEGASAWWAAAWQLHTTFPAVLRRPVLMTVGLCLSCAQLLVCLRAGGWPAAVPCAQVPAWPEPQPRPGEQAGLVSRQGGGQWAGGLFSRLTRAGLQLGTAFRRLSPFPGLL